MGIVTRRRALAGVALLVLAAAAGAAEDPGRAAGAGLKVLTAGAFKPVLAALAPGFSQRTGLALQVDNDTAGGLARRITAGEDFDLVVLTAPALQSLARDGRVDAPVPLARVAVGVAVAANAPRPDLSSVDAFRQALLQARAVAWIDPASGGSSGVYLAQLFERLGVAPQVRAKSVLVPGGLVAQRLLSGEADLAIHQVSEILAVPGVQLAGRLPAEIQNVTAYAGAVRTHSPRAEAARALLALLAGPQGRALLADKGMDLP